ncbi:7-carboxy-7-deazaguanine synthase [Pseudomonas putida]|uniref:7-carboxy-7-deazaguanine synthase n=1 Tax=Pseudomonas putida TaxID=303 RepID=UPI0039DFAEB5|nr:7-carboxy-7-deazaguanine synthase [Pseudomonas putida]
MTYSVKEIFYTLQGEGLRAGRPAVFCRFAGCNLWSGREIDRSRAICQFCDTDFVGVDGTLGGKFLTAEGLAEQIASLWPAGQDQRYVVLTGGEPLMQVDNTLIEALHGQHFEIAVETNGTLLVPPGIDWICVSPKSGSEWIQRSGHELKLVYPQVNLLPDAIVDSDFQYYLLQPMDGPMQRQNTRSAIAYCQANTKWRLSVQTHKILEIR